MVPIMLFTYSPVEVKAVTSSDTQWDYTLDSNYDATITRYNGDSTTLTIPQYIDGRKVVSIGVNAFIRYNSYKTQTVPNTTLTTLTIPEGIKTIQTGAFGNCTALTTVQTPSTLESIGGTAFFKCTSLSMINFGSNLKSIGERAFFGTALTNVFIPANIESMGLNPFTNCYSLSTIVVDPLNQNFASEDNVLFNKNKTDLLVYPNGKTGTTYSIPNSVITIEGNAFNGNQYLSTVTFSKFLRSIGINAFNSSKITSISLPDSVTEIKNGAFTKCCNLTTVELPKDLEKIEMWAFYGCPLTSIDMPYHLQSIGEGAFQDSYTLKTVRFYGEKPSIGTDAFLHPGTGFSMLYNEEYETSWTGMGANPFTVEPLDIQMKYNSVDVTIGRQKQLQAVLTPSWIPADKLNWTTENESIGSVDSDGWFSGLGLGTTTVHVTTSNGKTTQCTVNVITPYTSGDGNWIYQTDENNEATILSYQGAFNTVTIPSEIDGKTVIGIADFAFQSTGVTSVIIPNSVINIGCQALTGLALQSIQVEDSNPVYSAQDGVLYSKDLSTLVRYPAGKTGSSFTVAEQVINIAPYAFAYSTQLGNVTLPSNLKELETGVFADCTKLNSIIIPDSVTMISSKAFFGCTVLTQIKVPYYIDYIGDQAFAGCPSLEETVFIGEKPTMGADIFNGASVGFKIKYNARYSSTWSLGYETLTTEATNISPDSITLVDYYQMSITDIYLVKNQTMQLTAMISPFWVTDPSISWTSSKPEVATVSQDGLITAKSVGNAVITATSADGLCSAQCAVQVNAPMFYIRFNNQDNTVGSAVVYEGSLLTPPEVEPRLGYTLTGWYKEAECVNRWNFAADGAYADIILYAKWSLNQFVVNFNSLGGSDTAGKIADVNSLLTPPASPIRNGYSFAGWFKDTGLTNPWNFGTDRITTNITLYAKWNINHYNVSFNTQGGNAIAAVNTDFSSPIGVPTNSVKKGYTFKGWYKEAGCVNPWSFTTDKVTGDTVLYALWSVNKYSITFNSKGGSKVNKKTVSYNTTFKAPTTPKRKGYVFKGWYKESSYKHAWNFASNRVTSNINLYAKWKKK
jgi:Listeria/Bacterioides repeat